MLDTQQKQYYQEQLPLFPFVSQNPQTEGLYKKKKDQAQDFKYIQHNPKNLVNFLVFDIDTPAGASIWHNEVIAPPNATATNRANGHAHLFYQLAAPVPKTSISRLKPLQYLAAIECHFSEILGADQNYANIISKNLLNDFWINDWIHDYKYTLDDLAEYLPDPEKQGKSKKLDYNPNFGLGRNCSIFNDVRKYAYRLRYLGKANTQSELYDQVLLQCSLMNQQFLVPLNYSELKAISKSIANWTYNHITPEEFSNIQRQRGKKTNALNILNEEKRKKEKEISKKAQSLFLDLQIEQEGF